MMKEPVLLSVVIPAYNVKDYIEECVNSIFADKQIRNAETGESSRNQLNINNRQPEKYSGIEVIIVDDGSTDGTEEICDGYAEQDNRIRVIHQKNSGVGAARNTGIRYAKGEWIWFIDADDWVNMEVVLNLIQKPEIYDSDLICFSMEMERPNGKVIKSSDTGNAYTYDLHESRESFQKLCLQNQMYWHDVLKDSNKYPVMTVCVNKLFRKSFLIQNHLLIKEIVAQHEDKLFNYECVMCAKKIRFYDSIAYHYRYRASSAVHSDGVRMINQIETAVHSFYDIIGKENRIILDGPFAYSLAQMEWTLVDRLAKSCSNIGCLKPRARQLKVFMKDAVIKDTFKKIDISKVEKRQHRIVCWFLKRNMTFPPIALCYIYYKIFG